MLILHNETNHTVTDAKTRGEALLRYATSLVQSPYFDNLIGRQFRPSIAFALTRLWMEPGAVPVATSHPLWVQSRAATITGSSTPLRVHIDILRPKALFQRTRFRATMVHRRLLQGDGRGPGVDARRAVTLNVPRGRT